MLRRLSPLVVALLALLPAGAAHAFDVPAGATWTQGYVTEADGTKLHYDLLRPKGLPADARTPVILSIGPYFGRGGQTGITGPLEGAAYDPVGTGPNDRFRDFIDGAKLFERGYSWIQFDLRGFGASSGCLDWAGPGEQADVRAAVEWTAAQPWSTGRVGMYGKSYDGVTGLVGAVTNPKGLAAVVAQEPVYDLYRYLYANGVRYQNALLTPALYVAIDATGGSLRDDPQGLLNAAQSPACYPADYLAQQDDRHDSAFWQARDLIRRAGDVRVPLLLTQGFLEDNTKPDGAFDLWSAVKAPGKRAWFGMWDHVRGNDVAPDGTLAMGRAGWFDEVMRFFDRHVRDVALADAPTDRDPPVAVQTSDGTWRSEAAWPPADAVALRTPLRSGSYRDDAQNTGTADGGMAGALLASPGHGIWTVSRPLRDLAHLAGVPVFRAQVGVTAPRANLVVDVYDIDAGGRATLISRGTQRVDRSGRVELPLYGDDWLLPAGHRVGVLVSGSNAEWWLHVPTLQTVQVSDASIDLPYLRYQRTATIQGGPAARLRAYLADAPFTVDPAVLAGAQSDDVPLPPTQVPAPKGSSGGAGGGAGAGASGSGSGSGGSRSRGRVVVRLARGTRGRVVAYGNAPSGFRVTVTLRQGTRAVARRTVTARLSAFRVTLTPKLRGRAGRVRVRARVVAVRGGVRIGRTSSPITVTRRR